jgi:hypothetical protein
VYFERTPDKTSDKDIYTAKVIPGRGAWLEFEIDKRDQVGVRIDRKRKQSVTVLLKAMGWTNAQILEEFGDFESMRATLEKDHTTDQREALLDIYRKLRPGEPPTEEGAQNLLDNLYFNPKRYDLAKVGRYKVNKKLGLDEPLDAGTLSIDDIVACIRFLVTLHAGGTTIKGVRGGEEVELRVEVDDIDHFGNRRLRSVGELIQNQVRTGLSRMERVVRERMTTQDVEAITPQTLINIRPVVASIKEFFGTSQLSQFMDQTNPLAGLTHKRRLSALGPGGLSRDRAEHRPDRVTVQLRADQPVRFRRDPLPQGGGRGRHRRGALPVGRRGGRARHRPGERAADRGEPVRRTSRSGACPGRRDRAGARHQRRLHGRLGPADGLGGHRDDPVPRTRRRQPGPDGLEHAAPGRSAGARRTSAGGHRNGTARRRRCR